MPDMPPKCLKKLKKLIWEYEDIFQTMVGAKGLAKVQPLHIELLDSTKEFPPVGVRKYSPHHVKEMKEQLEAMVKMGVLIKRPRPTPFVSPALCVKKPDGSIRICCDSRRINSMTKSIVHPLPHCGTITRDVKGKFFLSTDLLKFFWQVPLTKEASHLNGLLVPWGVYEWLACPMGLKQSAAWCSKILSELTRELHNVKSYVDDCLAWDECPWEFLKVVRSFFAMIRERNLSLSPKKTFLKQFAIFVGQMVDERGTQIDPERIKALTSVPRPETAAARTRPNARRSEEGPRCVEARLTR